MKLTLSISLLVTTLALSGCGSTDYHITESAPEFISRDSLRNSIHVLAATPIVHAGRAISVGTFAYINEPYKGWHIIDNTSPASPRNVAYLSAPGSLDGAVRDGFLYLQNSSDLVVLNISDPSNPTVTKRMENAVTYPMAPRE